VVTANASDGGQELIKQRLHCHDDVPSHDGESGLVSVRTNFRNADLMQANLRRAMLREANLTGANLSEADLSEAELSGADLTKANLRDTKLSKADLSSTDMTGIVGLTREQLEAAMKKEDIHRHR
jgi:uncharacterized protein YjbI with pentapeptide repeats